MAGVKLLLGVGIWFVSMYPPRVDAERRRPLSRSRFCPAAPLPSLLAERQPRRGRRRGGCVWARAAPRPAQRGDWALFLAMAIGLYDRHSMYGSRARWRLLIVSAASASAARGRRLSAARTDERVLRITIPESLDYDGLFDDLFEKVHQVLRARARVKTKAALWAQLQLTYRVALPDDHAPKAFLDELRCRNNLNHHGREATKGRALRHLDFCPRALLPPRIYPEIRGTLLCGC